ncbi:exodeoxyribonuclease V subunit beta [Psychromonas antarctica]|uniref:exodeoxyribonuclease V subunit beta n=1 Tax=Psychromonas antarctica TaxID=67573 RepID=UPI001EE8E3A9|nr:exodeoxyribonuclease V subunit beta [Psychromonas antarctica]MCG6202044.1 exodeoxyribonuclease V subunit beta [Psychromonas antarctica]
MTESITKSQISVLPLDALTFPLFGQRLIEASAGTGKTYTIASLFIRLLLGHGDSNTDKNDLSVNNAHRQPLTVEQILVVTFTEAATAELRSRIRERIVQVRLDFLLGSSEDPFTQALITQSDDQPLAIRLLRFAELQMDEAAIYTIHGFCQRMLMQNAFESGSLFQQTLLEDDSKLLLQACNDFWRSHFYDLSAPLTELIFSYWQNPEQLKKQLHSWLSRNDLQFLPHITNFDFKEKYQSSLQAIEKLKTSWLKGESDYADIINYSDVSKRSYTKKNLPNWLAEISQWAYQSSASLSLPKNLERFSQKILDDKTATGAAPKHAVFSQIEALLELDLALQNTLLIKATYWVRAHLQSNKQLQMLLGFDDLLSRLDDALQHSVDNHLAQQIRATYPIALIDEFQDTDPVQYRIFHSIYQDIAPQVSSDKSVGLFMIGDPKQAIYSFRGADIFTYMQARQNVTAHYSLDYNYRSTPAMIDAVNAFFAYCPAPFIYNDAIPFIAVKAPDSKRKKLVVANRDDNAQSALQFIHMAGGENVEGFKESITQACVNEIKTILLLAQQGQAYLEDDTGVQRAIRANDIAILVRTGKEAALIRKALLNENINSVYLSLKESVYATTLAQDLLRILQACLNPENERLLRSAIACKLFAQSPNQVHELLQDTHLWENKIMQFMAYRAIWAKAGVLAMLHKLFHQQGISAHLLKSAQGERALTDLLHLAELLQKNSVDYDGDFALLRWFSEQIKQANSAQGEQKQRLESEKDLVQVSTLHKSKGLEYDIVFMPYTGLYQKATECLYHDPNKQHQLIFDLDNNRNHFALTEKEQLAEELRLLYVGLTRSIYRCYIGIGSYKTGRVKNTPLAKSALGYICLQGQGDLLAGDSAQLNNLLEKMCQSSSHIAVRTPPTLDETPYRVLQNGNELVSPVAFSAYIEKNYWISSYSSLSRFHSSVPVTENKLEKPEQLVMISPIKESVKSPFTFPRGAKHGSFLHQLFESIDFNEVTREALNNSLNEQLQQHLYSEPDLWSAVLALWIEQILDHNLSQQDVRLRTLTARQKKVEMQFFINMKLLHAREVNALMQQHDPLSARAGELQFQSVQGFLKGFIDLTFEINGQYYILDYKSNYLGDNLEDYNQQNIELAMIEHRYDFQYQLYTLALHRLLKSRLSEYNYETHIGGVFYTFIRGMQGDNQFGVYFNKPSFALIDGLDKLFSGQEKPTKMSQEPLC